MEENRKYDVSVIGGGIAGLTLAIRLADAGHSCALFEKSKYPFHKVCGEYISNESRDFLIQCGLELDTMDLPKIGRLRVSSPSGKIMQHRLDLGGFGISRFLLDQKLMEIARKKGVEVRDDCRVNDVRFNGTEFSIDTSEGFFASEICVGAWGKKSNLDTRFGRKFTGKDKGEKNYVGIKYHVYLDFPDDLIELHNFENGYCGISKVESNRYCLCYLSDSENLKKFNGDIRTMEAEVLMKNPYLKKYFSEAQFLFEAPLAISNIRIGNKKVVERHILMIGDCAGNIAPLSGNGMSMAMRSGFELSKLLEDYFERKISREQLEKAYERKWSGQFRKRIGISRILQKMLKSTSLTNITLIILKKIPFLRKALIRSTHGKPF